MARLGMVIDLERCVGCGACAFACKAENNTRTRGNGQSFNWADFVMQTEGTFPNVTHRVMPVLCNHCTDAPCVKACPADDCRWAFYDRSRNRSGTWCDMSDCGNRAKARAYRKRHQAEGKR